MQPHGISGKLFDSKGHAMELRRKFKRLPFQAPAFMVEGERTVYGELDNLSNMGMFIRTPGRLKMDASIMVSVYFHGESSTASITLPATVVRHDQLGVGIYSPNISIMSFLELQNLLSCHGGKREALMNEFYRFADVSREWQTVYPAVNN